MDGAEEKKLRQIYREIFGTDDIGELKQIAEKAKKYDTFMDGPRPFNVRNAGRKEKASQIEAQNIREDYKNGVSVAEIARRYSLSRPTIYRYLKEVRRWKEDA